MKLTAHKILLVSLLAMASFAVKASPQAPQVFTPDQKLRYAEAIIENFYVDSVNADTLVVEAIQAMLKTLDPHSAYSSKKETEELTQPLDGKFSGIGIQFSVVRDTVCVVQTTIGGPAAAVGIMPGDRIVYVNDSIFTWPKIGNNDVTKVLRGPKGSVANLRVKRAGNPELIDFRIVRDDIPIYSVDGAYMVTPEVGYIRVSRYAEDTPNEVARAIDRLKTKGMRQLIIDLEGNGGGYLGAAYGMASEFLKNGDLVVSTMGSSQPRQELRVEHGGGNNDIDRVVVMVDQFSASASEILAGALQDHDRAVIVGRRTFGKGLVQRPFPFPDGSMMRLTTSRYYTPSGRSIQKPYVKGKGEEYQLDLLNRYKSGELWSADSIHFDESKKVYTLRNHRPVYGGGGIMPDAFVPVDTSYYTTYYRDLVAKGVVNRYVTDYLDAHRTALLAQYPDEDAFAAGFDAAQMMPGLVEAGDKEGVKPDDEKLAVSAPMLQGILKGLLERDLYENGSYMRSVNPLNPVFNRALEIITDPVIYNQFLN